MKYTLFLDNVISFALIKVTPCAVASRHYDVELFNLPIFSIQTTLKLEGPQFQN